MEPPKLSSSSGVRQKKKYSENESHGLSGDVSGSIGIHATDSTPKKITIEPITPAKVLKRERSVVVKDVPSQLSLSQSKGPTSGVIDNFTTFSHVKSAGRLYNIKLQIVELWYKKLYSQTRPKSITFVAIDEEETLFEVIVSDVISEKWAPRLEEGNVYKCKRLLSSGSEKKNEKKPIVIDTQFQLNFTKDTKCIRLNKAKLADAIMLPFTKLNELPLVRPIENTLRHCVAYVIDVRPASVRTQKNGDLSRFVETYLVDETSSKTSTVLTVWDNIYEQYEDLFGHGFTKPFIVTAIGLKVRDFRGRSTLSASNFTKFYTGAAHNVAAVRLQEWVTKNLELKILDRRDLLFPERLITLSEFPEIKTIRQLKAETPEEMRPNEVLKFVVHGMILDIDLHHQIHYDACDQCNRGPGDRSTPSSPCRSCGKSPVKIVPRFLLTMTIGDSQDVTKVTAFDRDAQEILYMQVEKALEIRAQQNGYDELKRLANQALRSSYSFYLSITKQNLTYLARSGYKVQMLDWIPRHCLQGSESYPADFQSSDLPALPGSSCNDEDISSGDSYVEVDSSSTSTATIAKSK